MKKLLGLMLIGLPLLALCQNRVQNSLNGEWRFALDPVKMGEKDKWFDTSVVKSSFDKVQVPHCFSTDPRYLFYTGTTWYFKQFDATPPVQHRVYLKFDAVFYKSKIWLNGQLVGQHEGGYTPFELDITTYLQQQNTLAVQVDNAWDATTIPGAKTYVSFSSANNRQVYPWINYGGITRPVHLVYKPLLHLDNTKITAAPDLDKKNATVSIKAFVKNTGTAAIKPSVAAAIFYNDSRPKLRLKSAQTIIEAGQQKTIELKGTLPAAEVKLWDQDHPNLYTAVVTTGKDTVTTAFGIRKIEVKGTQLLLNGRPVKMGGCNRPLDYPGYGSTDPDEALAKDMQMIKEGAMELSRISHYPVSEKLLDWADKHGILIITEAGNWQMTAKQMSDTLMREKFRSQMREMIERDWNHPSVIAYSMGNEFQSQTEDGKAWVLDMRAYTKSLDDTRLITFSSYYVFRDEIKNPEDEASQYVDFVSANVYNNHEKILQHIHTLYPNKPVYVSEFGMRADFVKDEEERAAHLKSAMEIFRKYDYLIGASVWTFNDYFSRFPGSNANGYRPWGLVSPERTPRGMYKAWQEEFAPATITLKRKENGTATIRVTARKDFPSYTLQDYQLRYNEQTITLKTLNPGDAQEIELKNISGLVTVALIKPGGFVILKKNLNCVGYKRLLR